MQESVDDRKFWNIMKGIGIICVVVGHSGSWLTPYVYMFHMVLFVFISGYLFNERYVGDLYIYVWIHELPLTKISSAIYLDKNWWLVYSFVGIIMPVILMRTYKYIAKTIKSQIKCLIYR